jgi:hypothetical protein
MFIVNRPYWHDRFRQSDSGTGLGVLMKRFERWWHRFLLPTRWVALHIAKKKYGWRSHRSPQREKRMSVSGRFFFLSTRSVKPPGVTLTPAGSFQKYMTNRSLFVPWYIEHRGVHLFGRSRRPFQENVPVAVTPNRICSTQFTCHANSTKRL